MPGDPAVPHAAPRTLPVPASVAVLEAQPATGREADPVLHLLDLYLPRGATGYPNVVFVHGGGYQLSGGHPPYLSTRWTVAASTASCAPSVASATGVRRAAMQAQAEYVRCNARPAGAQCPPAMSGLLITPSEHCWRLAETAPVSTLY